jgi:26S proteasome regulatory subunit N3
LLNLLLRNYFVHNLYDQADKLLSKSTFPENAGNNQAARYSFYLGRIKALQLDYSSAHTFLTQAIRKAPQNNITAGFQQTVSSYVRMCVGVESIALTGPSFTLGPQILPCCPAVDG